MNFYELKRDGSAFGFFFNPPFSLLICSQRIMKPERRDYEETRGQMKNCCGQVAGKFRQKVLILNGFRVCLKTSLLLIGERD